MPPEAAPHPATSSGHDLGEHKQLLEEAAALLAPALGDASGARTLDDVRLRFDAVPEGAAG